MPYTRRFYYLPRTCDNKETDVLTQCDSLWKFEGTSLDPQPAKFPGEISADTQKSFQDLPDEQQLKQLMFKKILGILNKMTPSKFHKLVVEIKPETLDQTGVQMMAEVIFSKVLEDEIYVHLYSRLCDEILCSLTEHKEHFIYVITNLCETGCSNLLQHNDDIISNINIDRRFIYKRRFMTLMRFMGELSVISNAMFDNTYIHSLIDKLIGRGDEVHLEAVYYLLFTCALRNVNIWPEELWLVVARLSKGLGPAGHPVSSRIRFMFLSLVESRVGVLHRHHQLTSQSPHTSDSETNEQVTSDYKGF